MVHFRLVATPNIPKPSDLAASRTLPEGIFVDAQMTLYLCTTSCQGPNSSALTGFYFAGWDIPETAVRALVTFTLVFQLS